MKVAFQVVSISGNIVRMNATQNPDIAENERLVEQGSLEMRFINLSDAVAFKADSYYLLTFDRFDLGKVEKVELTEVGKEEFKRLEGETELKEKNKTDFNPFDNQ